jgi:hypothetical protein
VAREQTSIARYSRVGHLLHTYPRTGKRQEGTTMKDTKRQNRTGPPRWANRLVLAVLHSPAHALLDGKICELTYRPTDSGRLVVLPVRYVGTDNRVLIAVGNADAKRWWRAFRHPRPVKVRRRGRIQDGVGRVLVPPGNGYTQALLAYHMAVGTAVPSGTPLVVIETLEPSVPPGTDWAARENGR